MKSVLLTPIKAALIAVCMALVPMAPALAEDSKERVLRFGFDFYGINFNPLLALTTQSFSIQQNIFVTLVRRTDTEFAPRLALDWEVSEDKTQYRFLIRDDAFWSDGVKITPESIVQSLHLQVMNNKVSRNVDGSMPQIFVDEAGWVTMQYATPTNDVLLKLSYPDNAPMPMHVQQDVDFSEDWLDTPPPGLVYSGPYLIEDFDNEVIAFRPNPYYYAKDTIKNGGIDLVLGFENPREVFNAYMEDRLDFAALMEALPDSVLQTIEPERFETMDTLSNTLLLFNTKRPPFDDVRIRKALTLVTYFSANKGFFRSQFRDTHDSFVLEEFPSNFEIARPYWSEWTEEERLARARALMAEAGYSPENPLEVNFTFEDDASQSARLSVLLRAQWVRVGFRAALDPQDFNALIDNMVAGKNDVTLVNWDYPEPSPHSIYDMFRTDSPYNVAGFSNDALNEMLAEWKQSNDPVRLNQLSLAIHDLLMEHVPAMAFMRTYNIVLKNPAMTLTSDGSNFNYWFQEVTMGAPSG